MGVVMPAPRLLSVATALPPYRVDRSVMAELAGTLFSDEAERLLAVCANSGIEQRHSCMPPLWYILPHGWAERSRLFVEHGLELAAQAASACLARCNTAAQDVDALVMVSTTGVCTPSLDALLLDRLGMRPDVVRLPIFGLGCAGGALGLARAAALSRSMPGARVLLVVVELCGLTFRCADRSKGNIVASALFGDGAAAALVAEAGAGPRISAWGEHCWPDSAEVMGWRIEDDGFGVLFSPHIPALVREQLRPALDGWLASQHLRRQQIDLYLCHPGGAKVIVALEEALGLPARTLSHERAILKACGNMSAATVLFVIERALRHGALPPRTVVTALGPGFTAAFVLLQEP
ncbi:MAG: type III polyketide synthase [Magnetospirillum sp.]|nr:type III polyketide synthase [Magnetospirillum sp.]